MQPTMVELPEREFVGLGTKFVSILSPEANNVPVIPRLWHDFVNRTGEIGDRVGLAAYGLVEMLPASEKPGKGEMFYVACAEVSRVGQIPAGMISRVTAAGHYAKFTHKGKLDGLGKTMGYIYGEWLAKSGLKRRSAADIELYDGRFDMGSDGSEFDIFVPVG